MNEFNDLRMQKVEKMCLANNIFFSLIKIDFIFLKWKTKT